MPTPATHLVQRVEHEADAGWLMALWLAIHGGDPAPSVIAAQIIEAVAPYLAPSARTLTFREFEQKLNTIGVKVTEDEMARPSIDGGTVQPRQFCFKFKDQVVCIPVPLQR